MEKYAISVTNAEFTTNVELGLHELITDEPVQLGGQDKGASPYGATICCPCQLHRYHPKNVCQSKKMAAGKGGD